MSIENSELVSIDSTAPDNTVATQIAAMRAGNIGIYAGVSPTSFGERVALMKAVSGSAPVAENLNKVMNATNVIIQTLEMADETTGEMGQVPRITIVTAEGESFSAISGVLLRDVTLLFAVMGEPASWPTPVPLVITKEGTGNRKYFKLEVAEDAPVKK